MSANEQIRQNEQAINSYTAKTGAGRQSDSSMLFFSLGKHGRHKCLTVVLSAVDSGVNEQVTAQFPGSTVQVGGTKRGENPPIPDEEGGGLNPGTGQWVIIRGYSLGYDSWSS